MLKKNHNSTLQMNQPLIQEPGGGPIERYVPPEPFCVVFVKRSFPILSTQFERVDATRLDVKLVPICWPRIRGYQRVLFVCQRSEWYVRCNGISHISHIISRVIVFPRVVRIKKPLYRKWFLQSSIVFSWILPRTFPALTFFPSCNTVLDHSTALALYVKGSGRTKENDNNTNNLWEYRGCVTLSEPSNTFNLT